MKCPTCPDTTLIVIERQGVEIDYCPACLGIWLDRGELDKLLDHAASDVATASSEPAPAPLRRTHPDYRSAVADILENFAPKPADRAPAGSPTNVIRAAERSRR